jgi:hypothetical protein
MACSAAFARLISLFKLVVRVCSAALALVISAFKFVVNVASADLALSASVDTALETLVIL